MRFLVVDYYYPSFVDSWYDNHPGLVEARYVDQRISFDEAAFGETTFEAASLRALGHEANDVIINLFPAQAAWAREHRINLPPQVTTSIRLRRGLVPWPTVRPNPRWIGAALLAQVRELRPDVVLIQCMDVLDPALIPEVRESVRLVVGQVATELPAAWRFDQYDLVVSSIGNMVDRFREDGIPAEWLPLAFEPSLLDHLVPSLERDIPVSFVGSLSARHPGRVDVLEAVAYVAQLEIWTADVAALDRTSNLRRSIRGTAWGRDMYRTLGRSRITINQHGAIAGEFANNLRLYEATGMGALLITDAKANLAELFEPGSEVVTYDSPRECAEHVSFYVDHPGQAAEIAAAGRARTLRDHTWLDRMERLVEMVSRRL